MTAAAWDGWGKMHVKPHVAACYYFSAVAATLTTASVQLTDMTDFRPLYLGVCTFPFVGFMVTNVLNNVVFWRHGPVLAHHKLYTAVLLLGVCLLLPSGLLGYVGPIEAVPFHNRFYFICIAIAGTVCASHILAAGGSKAEHPLQPRTSILQPFVRGTIHAAQLMDAVTDLGVIGDLMEQKRSGCWWFGEEGNCQAWTGLISVFATLTSGKLLLSLTIALAGGDTTSQSRRMQRLVFASEVGAMVCELGVACCTLLHIYSLRASSARQQQTNERKTNSQIALGLVSLTVTLTCLALMLIGATVALKAMGRVWNTVRTTFGAIRKEVGSMLVVQGIQVVPDPDNGDGHLQASHEKLVVHESLDSE